MSTPAERLKIAREKAGWKTASEAARSMDVPVSTYINHEGDERGFWEDMPKYARFFKVNLEWLMTGRGPMHGNKIEQAIRSLAPEQEGEVINFIDYLRTKNVGPTP